LPLRHRRQQDHERARLVATPQPRGGAGGDGPLVRRQLGLGAGDPRARVHLRTAGPAPGMSLRILQFGATGQLSREVLARAGGEVAVTALSRAEVDLADAEAVARAIGEAGDIDLVLNAAAYTAVDRAESEPDLAYAINGRAPAAMARACKARNVPLVHISTDMVFSGAKDGPYVETDPVGPLMVYGASKLAGEDAVLHLHDRALVIRVSWLFSAFGQNFLQLMLRLAASQPVLKVVNDQRA